MPARWSTRFEIKPGRWVFVPTNEVVNEGRELKAAIEQIWTAPEYYFHLRPGGHVAALKEHIASDVFLHLDIEDFFGSISANRISRALKGRVGYLTAREWATKSVVRHPSDPKKTILPFGFVQSQILASLVLHDTALGRRIHALSKRPEFVVTVYVDDILISCPDVEAATVVAEDLKNVAGRSNFVLNAKKTEGPASTVTAFNVVLAKHSLAISEVRMNAFKAVLETTTSPRQRDGILRYIAQVNAIQAEEASS
ncbi:putative RNA-directed DNA polymerase [Cupriavidus taiwanensis]|uniref:reverse transcriptase domain-containing protein n=1 Tax=Cupriavidus taiwanensis TaxID=164546 RepID=UPI000E1A8F0C|nr:reverse transcriptase domain-containing protein [Cupriavidus taiwanensis]SOY93391.1 putative RNA-directed DNA polymerase [Cupriavidus taiwanensis]SOY96361.1 putative RNA-directed DNA polymerase [Cupriavidus taiwanensis]